MNKNVNIYDFVIQYEINITFDVKLVISMKIENEKLKIKNKKLIDKNKTLNKTNKKITRENRKFSKKINELKILFHQTINYATKNFLDLKKR